MNWEYRADGYTADAQTSFVKMRVFVDQPHTKGMDAIRYEAMVTNLNGMELVSKDNIAEMAVARIWCETQYAILLRNELHGLD